jgi:hypothetical protein
MKVEILQNFRDEGQQYTASEIRVVSEQKGGYFCGVGWARDISGAVATGAPDLSNKSLDVKNARHSQKSTIQE